MHKSENKKTILVVEDKKPLLEVVNARLRTLGFGVITARSVDEVFDAGLTKDILSVATITDALDYFDNLEHIDGIWLDHNLLGKKSGLDLIKELKSNGGRWKKIPIFVISNTENPQTIQSYVDLGIQKYYVKSNHRLDDIINDIHVSLGTAVASS